MPRANVGPVATKKKVVVKVSGAKSQDFGKEARKRIGRYAK
jgi:hypothetical protein